MTAPGYRFRDSGMLGNIGSYGYSWSSSVSGNNARYLDFNSTEINPQGYRNRGYGFPVRCLQE